MGLIASISGLDRDIYLSAETVGATIHPMDLYKEYRTMRRSNESLRKYLPFMRAEGNVAKGGGAYTERYVVLTHGARIVPYNVSHTLTITGTIINDAGQSGINCFDRTELSSTTYVNLNYVPPQVEVIVVTVSGSNVITGDIAQIPAAPSASAIATAVLAAAEVAPIASDVVKVNAVSVAGTGSDNDPWGPA